jgi:hypothetical protein
MGQLVPLHRGELPHFAGINTFLKVGRYKLNPVVTHSLKAPGDPTLEPMK